MPTQVAPNLWNQVDDFKWLRAEHSPNWSILTSEDDRAIDANEWNTIASSSTSHLTLDEISKAARIIK